MEKNRKIIITGVPGVGKTRVISDAVMLSKKKYRIISFGSEMLKAAISAGLAKDRDEMRKLDSEMQRKLQDLAAKKIAEESKSGNIIIDTHATIETEKGYLCGIPLWVIEEIMPSTIVIIESKEAEILGRILKDDTRERDKDTIEYLRKHQELNRCFVSACCVMSGAALSIIQNKTGSAIDAAKELARILEY